MKMAFCSTPPSFAPCMARFSAVRIWACVMLGHRGVEVLPPAGSTPAEVLAEVLNLPDGMLSVNTSPSIRDQLVSTAEMVTC